MIKTNRWWLVIIAIIFAYNAANYLYEFRISESDLNFEIIDSLKLKDPDFSGFETIKEIEDKNTHVILFRELPKGNENLGVAIFRKGINGRYFLEYAGNDKLYYSTVVKTFGKTYILTIGDNTDKRISYLKTTEENRIEIKDDYYIEFVDMTHSKGYNFYNANNEIEQVY